MTEMTVTQQAVSDWLTAHDLDPHNVAEVAIRFEPNRAPRLDAVVYDLNEKGQKYLPRGCTGWARSGVEHPDCAAVSYRVAMPLRSFPATS